MTPRQTMKKVWEAMETGEIKPSELIILYRNEPEPGTKQVSSGQWVSDMYPTEFITMLTIAKTLAIRTYLGEGDDT